MTQFALQAEPMPTESKEDASLGATGGLTASAGTGSKLPVAPANGPLAIADVEGETE